MAPSAFAVAALVTAASWAHSAVADCSVESVAKLRSDRVAADFEPKGMEGFWYEHAYIDPAQMGASCPTLNAKVDNTTGEIATDFSVLYSAVPFTIKEYYEPVEPAVNGVYKKHVQIPFGIPGGSLIRLPTAIVDAQMSKDGSRYETLIMYSCWATPLATVRELVVATRSPEVDHAVLKAMLQTARERGVEFEESSVSFVDRAQCSSSSSVASKLMELFV
eukprot:CAMPEP_0171231124 /NCGR_PEP_ID=MMETSP0790-20130122/39744_1 /TAXON_ID=2925 /ORGANISM="Alexandrium catenella, Strain OF101" /LENGTH=219 /DNA_ID=CAMNT_0011697345 /DNA_START=40 /DNA_END=699 /DNA_ORIENTATION=-